MVSPARDLFLCLDQGGHASRAVIFDRAGTKLAEQASETVTMTNGLQVELDAESLLSGMQQIIAELHRQLGSEAHRVVAAGLATQRSNIACWDRQTGLALAPIFSWQDRRAGTLLDGLDVAGVHAKTGLYPNPHYGASKLAWCLRQLPEVMAAKEAGRLCLGPMASFLQYRLTSAVDRQQISGFTSFPAYADPANASRTMLYNLHEKNWDVELCEAFAIEQNLLPDCVPSRYDFGDLPWADVRLPLRVLTGDLSAAAFVHGTPKADVAYITLGTGAFVQRILPQALETDLHLLNGIVWDDGEQGLYSLEGTVNGAGSALQWFATEVGLEQESLQQQLAQWCEQVNSPPLFTNGVSGLGSPFWQADFSPRFIGEGDTAAQAVAVVESIVFMLYENLSLMHHYLPVPRQILVSGGLAALDGLCQRLADLSGIEVVRSAESEGTAKGLAYLLADMPDEWSVSMDKHFSATGNITLQQRYIAWRKLIYEETAILKQLVV